MILTRDDDMLIVLTHHVRTLGHNPMIEFAHLDMSLNFPEGTTARLLEVVAIDAGYQVVRKGATHASLHRKPRRLVRA